jgi:Carboxypeptidase regulatory-like domain
MKHSLLGWVVCSTLVSAVLAFGQSPNTSLRGTIKDPSGALVPGATITLVNAANGQTLSATADSTGNYAFPQIPPATYTITVTATGFGAQSKKATLLVSQPATVNFTLSVQTNSVTVDVSATTETLNTTDASLGNAVGNTTVQALPMEGRNPIALLTLQPGVLYLGNPAENSTMDTRSGSVNGGRSDQGNVTLDGIDDNDQLNGTAFSGVLRSTLDSTEEFRVTTANGTAEAGRSSGAEISLVTKSGTNQLHGAVYEYYRPTNTVANSWFNKQFQLSSGLPNIPQKYVLNTFGAALGGPIKKDKLFFFGNYEGQRTAINTIVNEPLPTAAFYAGEVGYVNTSGATEYLSSSDVAAYDAGCAPTGTPSVPCGVNPYVQSYFAPLNTAGFLGTNPSQGDGINSAGFVFASPSPATLNTSIGKIDYVLSSTQHLFLRGNLQKDTTAAVENLPGQPPNYFYDDNTKGLAIGHTWTPTNNIVNDLRYGYVRQGYAVRGAGSGTGDWVNFRFLAQPQPTSTVGGQLSEVINVPVQDIVDTFTWTRGNHTITLGGDWRNIGNNRSSDLDSYSNASTNPYWLSAGAPTPADLSPGFANSYEIAFSTIVGTVPETNLQENYAVTSSTSGTLIPDGSFINRHFKSNEFEYYLQDSWRVKSSLTVNFGLHHSILGVPYETHGQQVSPTIDTFQWFLKRGQDAANGDVYEPTLEFMPSGKANGAAGYWGKQKANLAPRLSVAWAPTSRTSLRVGAGMYFDHFGQAIVNTFDQTGSFGLSTTLESGAAIFSEATSPRFTGPHELPPLAGACGIVSPTTTFPSVPPSNTDCGFAIGWGIDNQLKTPYSYNLDASFQIELPGGFIFEQAYVGRLGRHLLQQLDLAEPVNLVDTGGGGDYFHAAAALSKIVDENGGNYGNSFGTYPNGQTPVSVPTIPYFEDMFPFMKDLDFTGESATEAIYNNEWAPNRFATGLGETTALADLDVYDYYGCPPSGCTPRFWSSQYASLYSWASIGTSSYNALQLTLRHPTSHGLNLDVNYTLSKSIDIGSGAETSNWQTSDAFGGADAIQNSWNPKLNRGPSDFDTRNLISLDWVYDLPVGRGKTFLSNANKVVDGLIGGIQWSGLSSWSSALPFSVFETGYTTNWNLGGNGVVTGPVQLNKHITNGAPQIFAGDSANTINNGIYSGNPIRYPYPGEAGQRNNFRGDGYFDIDSELAKTWNLGERMKLKLDAEVYNVPNSVRFDDSPNNLATTLSEGNFGYYGGVLTTYRRMEFGARIDF